jgi:8-oxo-dGTP pyrophosphatase MutT (NUDIX family)
MKNATLILAGDGEQAFFALGNENRWHTIKYTRNNNINPWVFLLSHSSKRQIRKIIIGIGTLSFSQQRVLISTGNALALVWHSQIQTVAMQKSSAPAQLLAEVKKAAWKKYVKPVYQKPPNISQPKVKPVHHITAGGIVYNPSRKLYLFVQRRDSKKLGLPKGHQERGEELVNTAKREIAEETGYIDLKTLAKLPSITFQFHEQGKLQEKVQYNFLFIQSPHRSQKRLNSSEVKNLRNVWLSANQAIQNKNLYPDLKSVIATAKFIIERRALNIRQKIK